MQQLQLSQGKGNVKQKSGNVGLSTKKPPIKKLNVISNYRKG